MADVDLEAAIARATANRESHWPERGKPNRLEPECWPVPRARFRLHPGAKVFAIGSCFARSVELHLAALGFDVPTRRFLAEQGLAGLGDEILNKYTPPSMYQELEWTKRIRDRDGVVTDEDVAPFLLDMGSGMVVDLQHRLTGQFGIPRRDAIEQRRNLYGLFTQAFDSDAAVVTLGLIECWFDRETGQYIEFGPHLRKHNRNGRFVFRRLDFAEAYEHTKKAIALLGGEGTRPILLTTSPIPLARTFTGDDVIVANAYSKSVLRAVAGQIAAEHANVDYFPSYESVMLTKQSYVWADDLTHVEGEFVGRVVGRMCEHYVAGDGLPNLRAISDLMQFSNLVRHRRFAEAEPLFRRLNTEEAVARGFALALVEMHVHLGEHEAVHRYAGAVREKGEVQGERGCLDLLRCARLLERAGSPGEAEAMRAQAIARLRTPSLIMSLIRRSATSGEHDDVRRIIAHVEAHLASNADLIAFAALTLESLGDLAAAERACRAALKAAPRNPDLLTRLGHVLGRQERKDEAIAAFETALEQEPGNVAALKKVIPAYFEAGRLADAERASRALTEAAPSDPMGHLHLASAMRRTGRADEALAHARRAAALEPGNARFARYVEELTGARPRRAGRASSAKADR